MIVSKQRRLSQELMEEIEVLNAIYGPDTIDISDTPDRSITCTLHFHDQAHSYIIGFPNSYPQRGPRLKGIEPAWMDPSPRMKERKEALERALGEVFVPGSVCMFDAIESVRDLLIPPPVTEQCDKSGAEDVLASTRVDIEALQRIEQCAACLEELIVPDLVELQCSHYLCTDCMHFGFETSMRSKAPLTCCKKALPLSLIKAFCVLSKDALYNYETMLLERSTKNPLYCSYPRCARFIRPDLISEGGEWVRCTGCRRSTCVHCRRGRHEGICKENRTLQEAIRTLGAKPCPKCGVLVEKHGGCKNMTCRCGHLYCWLCRKERDNSGPGCGCVLYG